MAIPFCARFIEPPEPRVPVRVSVLFTGTIDVVETVMAKLPVCTPFALPERLNVAFSVGACSEAGRRSVKTQLGDIDRLAISLCECCGEREGERLVAIPCLGDPEPL